MCHLFTKITEIVILSTFFQPTYQDSYLLIFILLATNDTYKKRERERESFEKNKMLNLGKHRMTSSTLRRKHFKKKLQ